MVETPSERNRRIFADATARDEPVFVIRAQDRHAPYAVDAYVDLLDYQGTPDPAFSDALAGLRRDVVAWQADHPDLVKEPDVR